MKTFKANLTNLTVLDQSHDCKRIMTPSSLRLQKHTDLSAHDFAYSPDLWHHPWFTEVTCLCSWRLCGINSAI